MNSNVVMGPVSMEQSSVTRCVTVPTTVTRPAVSKVGTDGSVLLVLHGVNLPGLRGLWKGKRPVLLLWAMPSCFLYSFKPFWQWDCLGEMIVLTTQTA